MSDMALSTASNGGGILDDYFTVDQLAAELQLTKQTLWTWRLQRKGPPATKLGRQVLYRRSSVKAWLAAQESNPTRK